MKSSNELTSESELNEASFTLKADEKKETNFVSIKANVITENQSGSNEIRIIVKNDVKVLESWKQAAIQAGREVFDTLVDLDMCDDRDEVWEITEIIGDNNSTTPADVARATRACVLNFVLRGGLELLDTISYWLNARLKPPLS